MSKSELAAAAGVHPRTLARWMQRTPSIRQLLRQHHITAHQQLLPPAVVKQLCEHLCIEVER